MPMTPEELEMWAEDFEAFHARFAHLFARREPREQMAKYLRGLLAPLPRKNGWQIAEAVGDATPDRTQRLLYRVPWDADQARDELERFVVETLGHPEGIGVADETGFLKKGSQSVGVKRQYTGTAGKVENCQVGVFLVYVTPKGKTFLDRRLYLPQEWCEDAVRRQKAKVPEEVVFRTKPQLAGEMLQHAWRQGVPMRWVTGDEVYGDSPEFRDIIRAQPGCDYVLAVSANTPVWTERPAAGSVPPAQGVAEVVAAWPEEAWQRLVVAEGEKGPRIYDWAYGRVVEKRKDQPGPDAWLLARRSPDDPTDIAYYLSSAAEDTPLLVLAQVASSRHAVEQVIEEGKGEAGLDEYEVRSWHSWHRHITLSMMAHAWLVSIRCRAAEKGGPSRDWPN